MEGNLEPEDVRAQKFEMVRRGYDKRQVDRFRDRAAVSLAALATELSDMREKIGQAGMADVADLKSELDAVSPEIAEILESARSAAEGMRSRASEDAARWRAEADKESRSARADSAKDAEQARRSAWEESTELLKQTDEEIKQVTEEAGQDALFIRAEAEREALRLTGDARRDKEEAARKARTDADRVMIEARAESERILEKARQSAQSAQGRAQALEQRRTELMQELEAARLSIGQMESEIDSRREALQTAAETPDSGVRVIKTSSDLTTEWPADDASVRIVPASRVAPDQPVDPDAFVAEVEQLQSAIATAEKAAARVAEEVSAEAAEPDSTSVEEPDHMEVQPAKTEPTTTTTQDEVASIPEPESEPPLEPEAPVSPGPEAVTDTTVEAEEALVPDGIDDLFAQLRTADAPAPKAPVADVRREESAAAPTEAAPVATAILDAAEDVTGPAATLGDVADDPFELRDRVLLPVENRTLRSVKRRIVDLQNRVLEELRLGDNTWEPDRSMFVAAVSDDIATMIQESFVGGHAAAAELLGEHSTPLPERAATQATSAEFIDALVDAAAESLKRARASGGGTRQVSAAVGRVFRAWRTDEAERRLRRAGYLAYNEGLLGAYPELGVSRVLAIAPGAPCGDCPAGTDISWVPGESLPRGTTMPPARPECRATILPAAELG